MEWHEISAMTYKSMAAFFDCEHFSEISKAKFHKFTLNTGPIIVIPNLEKSKHTSVLELSSWLHFWPFAGNGLKLWHTLYDNHLPIEKLMNWLGWPSDETHKNMFIAAHEFGPSAFNFMIPSEYVSTLGIQVDDWSTYCGVEFYP